MREELRVCDSKVDCSSGWVSGACDLTEAEDVLCCNLPDYEREGPFILVPTSVDMVLLCARHFTTRVLHVDVRYCNRDITLERVLGSH